MELSRFLFLSPVVTSGNTYPVAYISSDRLLSPLRVVQTVNEMGTGTVLFSMGLVRAAEAFSEALSFRRGSVFRFETGTSSPSHLSELPHGKLIMNHGLS